MTNKEFYGDKLLAIALEDYCHDLHIAFYNESCVGVGKKCEDCEFSGNERILQWLNAEHEKPEPPLLENGDGLQPGDWLMVRDDDDCIWHKRQFMCYFDDGFYCVNNAKQSMEEYAVFNASRWAQAHLPEDGE